MNRRIWEVGLVVGVFALLMLAAMAVPASAQLCTFSAVPASTDAPPIQFAPEKMCWTVDHFAINTGSSLETDRGATLLEFMWGSVAEANLGANRFELGLLSFGVGATGTDAQPVRFDGQVGLVLLCTDGRMLCGEFPKVTRSSNNQDLNYLFGLTMRHNFLGGMIGGGP